VPTYYYWYECTVRTKLMTAWCKSARGYSHSVRFNWNFKNSKNTCLPISSGKIISFQKISKIPSKANVMGVARGGPSCQCINFRSHTHKKNIYICFDLIVAHNHKRPVFFFPCLSVSMLLSMTASSTSIEYYYDSSSSFSSVPCRLGVDCCFFAKGRAFECKDDGIVEDEYTTVSTKAAAASNDQQQQQQQQQ
jgi:hypothetical protein